MLKLFADECIPTDLINALRESGADVLTVNEAKMTGKDDEKIFNYALKKKRTLFSMDRGFGDIFRFNIIKSHGVIVVLVSNMTKKEIISIPVTFISKLKNKDLKGKLVIVGKTKIRVIKR